MLGKGFKSGLSDYLRYCSGSEWGSKIRIATSIEEFEEIIGGLSNAEGISKVGWGQAQAP
jgi:hypothetical protein